MSLHVAEELKTVLDEPVELVCIGEKCRLLLAENLILAKKLYRSERVACLNLRD